jgi:hypothetical protein
MINIVAVWNSVVMWAFLACLFQLIGYGWLLGLTIGLGINMLTALIPNKK